MNPKLHQYLYKRGGTQLWLRLLRETDLVTPDLIAPLIDEARQLVAILTTIVKNARDGS